MSQTVSQTASQTVSQTDQSLPVPVPVRRVDSVDVLRGLLMLLMAIDHTRDYFSSISGVNPTDPLHSWPALFATRWITHLCAPGFIALAGASVYLQRQRGKSSGELAKLLFTRGLWLVFLEVTLMSFGWSFSFAPMLVVFWSIGVSMVFLSTLIGLPTVAIGVIGAAIVLLHNLADDVSSSSFGSGAIFWTILHAPGALIVHGHFVAVLAYPIVPWIGVICLGYAFGAVLTFNTARRQRIAAVLGASFLLVFTLLRIFHGYGDGNRFAHLATPAQTTMSFLQVDKYPPSLQYLLATLGVVLLLYILFDIAVTGRWLLRLTGFIKVYGRVPFFYYVLHIYLLHAAALSITAARHLDRRFWVVPYAVFRDHLEGWGYTLPGVYLVWLIVVLVLFYPCLWFSRLISRRRDWWLSYL